MTLRRAALAAALLLAACSRKAPPPAAGEVRIDSRGAVSALQLGPARLTFCDAGGMHEIELSSGRVVAAADACDLPAAASPEVTARTPDHGPDDVIEVEGVGQSFPIEGHARTWAADGTKVIVVATATEVLAIVTDPERRIRLSDRGADRVAVGGGWAAWWNGKAIVARRL